MSAPAPDKKTFNGSCHCGYIQYSAAFAIPDPPVASRCNCTICLKLGFTAMGVAPEDFKLIAPSSVGDVKNYQMKSKDVNKYFCGNCGIHCWTEGKFELGGKTHALFNINLVTLDQPQDGLDLSQFKIKYCDGRNDNWFAGLKDSPWPGGCV